MTLQSFREADFLELSEAWREFYGERYAVTPSQLREHTVGSQSFDWGASAMLRHGRELVAAAMVKRAPAMKYAVRDPDRYHLAALLFREPIDAMELMADLKILLRDRGATELVFGQDSRHFFPGVPHDCPRLRRFLEVDGFLPHEEVFDMEQDLAAMPAPPPLPAGLRAGFLTPADTDALDAFLRREFSGRWHFDVMDMAAREGCDRTVFGLWQDDFLIGFALLQDERVRSPVGGGVWRATLGENWGALGPIGVAADQRGQGFGDLLLGHALLALKNYGCRRTIIDWTTLDSFYGRYGFTPTRRYTAMTLDLSA